MTLNSTFQPLLACKISFEKSADSLMGIGFYSQRFWSFISHTGTLGCAVCLTSQFFLPVYPLPNVGPPALLAATSPILFLQLPPCHSVLSTWLPFSAPPTSLSKCYFFNSLVVGLTYSSIFWQFWLFFVFKFVVLLLVVWRGKVYLSTYASILAGNPKNFYF